MLACTEFTKRSTRESSVIAQEVLNPEVVDTLHAPLTFVPMLGHCGSRLVSLHAVDSAAGVVSCYPTIGLACAGAAARSTCAMAPRTAAAVQGFATHGWPHWSRNARLSARKVSPVTNTTRWHR
jgi:hypothetical protein